MIFTGPEENRECFSKERVELKDWQIFKIERKMVSEEVGCMETEL